jgi:hypothetical protein
LRKRNFKPEVFVYSQRNPVTVATLSHFNCGIETAAGVRLPCHPAGKVFLTFRKQSKDSMRIVLNFLLDHHELIAKVRIVGVGGRRVQGRRVQGSGFRC